MKPLPLQARISTSGHVVVGLGGGGGNAIHELWFLPIKSFITTEEKNRKHGTQLPFGKADR